MPSRKSRGRASEQIVADYLRTVFPHADRRPASLPGTDILNTPGWSVEVKARRGLDLTGWLRQAVKNSGAGVPVLVVRPDGYGPGRVDQWAAIVPLSIMRALMAEQLLYIGHLREKVEALPHESYCSATGNAKQRSECNCLKGRVLALMGEVNDD
jgi:hypothetical protein